MKKDIFRKLLAFLDHLDQAKISYTLARQRDEAIMVLAVVPGERWEIEFLSDGSVEVERFISDGEMYGEEVLDELLANYSDQEPESLDLSHSVELAPVAK